MFIFWCTSVRKYIYFIAVKPMLWIFFFLEVNLDRNYYSRMVHVSINQFGSFQFSAGSLDPLEPLTSKVCLSSLQLRLSFFTK